VAVKPGDILLNGQYKIIDTLGRGGFGFVYKTQDTLLNEVVALKEMFPFHDVELARRFLIEAKATMRLSHPNIVRTYNAFSEDSRYYIVMEYLPGGSLEDRLQREGKLPLAEAIRIMDDVCQGLNYAHQMGVVHCDVKPANVLFAADGTAKVGDFGIAHVSQALLSRSWHTATSLAIGTIFYMSPEQLDGVRDDCRVDVYALGAMLYQMLTGHPYLDFAEENTPAALAQNMMRVRKEIPRSPRSINRRTPRWLEAVVLKALAKDPAHRYPDADALRKALRRERRVRPRSLLLIGLLLLGLLGSWYTLTSMRDNYIVSTFATPTLGYTQRPTATIPPTTSTPVPAPICVGLPARFSNVYNGMGVRGQVHLRGYANLEDFWYYKVELGSGREPQEWANIGDDVLYTPCGSENKDGELLIWNTTAVPNGVYTLRLTVVDQTGNYPTPCSVWVRVEN